MVGRSTRALHVVSPLAAVAAGAAGLTLAGVPHAGAPSLGAVLASASAVTLALLGTCALPALLWMLARRPLHGVAGLLTGGAASASRGRFAWLGVWAAAIAACTWWARHTVAAGMDLVSDVAVLTGVGAGTGLVLALHALVPRLISSAPRLGPIPIVVGATLAGSYAWLDPLTRVAPAYTPIAFALLAPCWALSAGLIGTAIPEATRRPVAIGLAGACVVACAMCFVVPAAQLGSLRVGADASAVLRFFADRDGDGFSAQFGGGDCDDGDAEIHPRAFERPGNGHDDNCLGGDLSAVAPLPATRPRRTATTPPPDVVLLSIDAWRGDHFTPELMPKLTEYARRGRSFTRAYSSSSFTKLCMLSVMTGWGPGDFDFAGQLVGLDRPLADVLSELGYSSMAVHASTDIGELPVLGFQFADTHLARKSYATSQAPEVTAAALRWLQKPSDAPRLLWVHYLEPHHWYMPHEGFAHLGNDLHGLYRQEVAFTDKSLAPLLAHLSQPEVAARTVVVVFADHGEALGERGEYTHAYTLSEAVTHVPLIVRAPGVSAAVVDTPVSTVDIFPTVVDLVEIEGVEPRDGISLLAPRADRALLAESRYLYESLWTMSIRRGDWLLHCNDGGGPCELFDTRADPRCERDVSRDHGETQAALRLELGQRLDPFRSEERMRARRAAFEARWR